MSAKKMNDPNTIHQKLAIIARNTYKQVVLCIFIGLIIGYYFSSKIQPTFESNTLYKVAQIASGGTILNGSGINVEEPSTLVFRYQNKATFDSKTIQACLDGDAENNRNYMADIVKISSPKVGNGIIEIRVMGSDSPEKTEACAANVVEEIGKYHQKLVEPARKVLEKNIDEMLQNKKYILQSGVVKSYSEDLIYLEKRIEELKFQKEYSQLHVGETLNSNTAFKRSSMMIMIKIYLICIILSIFSYFTIKNFFEKK